MSHDHGADDPISISACAKLLPEPVHKSVLAKQVKSGMVRSHNGKVRLSEVIEDRAKNVDHDRAHRRSRQSDVTASVRVASKAVASRVASTVASTDATRGATDATLSRFDATPVGGDPLISISACAKLLPEPVHKSVLAKQVKSGAVRSHRGMVRLSEVLQDRLKNINLTKAGARKSKRARSRTAEQEGADDPDLDIQQFEMVEFDGKLLPFAQAQAIKENYLAKLRQLEYLSKSSAVVDRQAAETLFFHIAREGRDAWMNWAPRVSVLMAAELKVEASQLTEILARYVQQHLGELGEPVSPELLASNGQPAGGLAARADPAASPDGARVGREEPAAVEGV